VHQETCRQAHLTPGVLRRQSAGRPWDRRIPPTSAM
jgi:hypothetical protein